MNVGQLKLGKLLEDLEDTMVPKCENPIVADNQQEKPLAYIIGVYFGDGCIQNNWSKNHTSETKFFRLEVIDEDFRNYTAKCCELAFPKRTATKFVSNKLGKPFYGLQVRGIGNYIESITGKRKMVPNFIYENDQNKKAFIEGMLDSEGWVQIQTGIKGTTFRAHIGFAITSEVVHELKRMLESLNVKVGKIGTYTKGRKRALKQINLNLPSFIESGLKFNIARKQVKVEAFRLIKEVIEIANTISRKIHRGSLTEQNPNSLREMVCSELHSDMQRLAEMTNPVHKNE